MGRFFTGALAGLLALLIVLVLLVVRAPVVSKNQDAAARMPGSWGTGRHRNKLADVVSVEMELWSLNLGETFSFQHVTGERPSLLGFQLEHTEPIGAHPTYSFKFCSDGIPECAQRTLIGSNPAIWAMLPVPKKPDEIDPVTMKIHVTCLSWTCKGRIIGSADINSGGSSRARRRSESVNMYAGSTPAKKAPIGTASSSFSSIFPTLSVVPSVPILPYNDMHLWWHWPFEDDTVLPSEWYPTPWGPDKCGDLYDDSIPASCFASGCEPAGTGSAKNAIVFDKSEAVMAIFLPWEGPKWDLSTYPPTNLINQDDGSFVTEHIWLACTGYLVGHEGLVLTANHCANGEQYSLENMEFYFEAQAECPYDANICDYSAGWSMYKCASCDLNVPYADRVNNGNWNTNMTHSNMTDLAGGCLVARDIDLDFNLIQIANPSTLLKQRLTDSYNNAMGGIPLNPIKIVPRWYIVRKRSLVYGISQSDGNPKRVQYFDNRNTKGHAQHGYASVRTLDVNPSAVCCPSDTDMWNISTWWDFINMDLGYKYDFRVDVDMALGASGSPLLLNTDRPLIWWAEIVKNPRSKLGEQYFNLATPEDLAAIKALDQDQIHRLNMYLEDLNQRKSDPTHRANYEPLMELVTDDEFLKVRDHHEESEYGFDKIHHHIIDIIKQPSGEGQKWKRYLTCSDFDREKIRLYLDFYFNWEFLESEEFYTSKRYQETMDAFEYELVYKKFGPYNAFAGRSIGMAQRWNDEAVWAYPNPLPCGAEGKWEFVPTAHQIRKMVDLSSAGNNYNFPVKLRHLNGNIVLPTFVPGASLQFGCASSYTLAPTVAPTVATTRAPTVRTKPPTRIAL